jgi:hypothetical protein
MMEGINIKENVILLEIVEVYSIHNASLKKKKNAR